jgi:hypothetical protein
MTPEDLGVKAGCTGKTIESMENGGRSYYFTIANVAEALGKKAQDLLAVQPDGPLGLDVNAWDIEINVTVKTPFGEFNQTVNLQDLLTQLNKIAGFQFNVAPSAVADGSTVITLRMKQQDALRLLLEFRMGTLDALDVIDVSIVTPPGPETRKLWDALYNAKLPMTGKGSRKAG